MVNRGGGRQSNIELVRILAMFLILVIHANMVSLQRPTATDLSEDPSEVVFRYLLESIGIVSVNLFVLISGWFSIRPKAKRMLSFIYQVVFLWVGMLMILVLIGETPLTLRGVATSLALTTTGDWFIKAYIVLCIIAPILNIFVENTAERTVRDILIWFYIFQSTYGLLGANRFFLDGYGPLSFIGLYLLAQYARRVTNTPNSHDWFNRVFQFNKWMDILIFISTTIINTMIGVLALKFNIDLYGKIYAYTNPLNVIGALYLFLFFTKIDIGVSSLINWLAASSFAVYLLHGNQMRTYFTNIINDIYQNHNGVKCVLLIFGFLVFVYLLSVIIDQLRIISWNVLCKLKEKCQTTVKQ